MFHASKHSATRPKTNEMSFDIVGDSWDENDTEKIRFLGNKHRSEIPGFSVRARGSFNRKEAQT